MKKLISITILCCSLSAVAQDTYVNEQSINSSDDVIGTSRFVGMGGAMGALGADMSVIGWNPAGIGLFRKNDVSITFGGLWNKSKIKEEGRGAGTFDQAGFVYSFKTESDVCPYVNFAFNYQKKKNFNRNFYADSNNPIYISQMDQLAELASAGYDTNWNLAGLAVDYDALSSRQDAEGKTHYYNEYYCSANRYIHHSEGSLRSFDLNVSTNINDRFFLGFTFGVDNLDYSSWYNYYEVCGYNDANDNPIYGNYGIRRDKHTSGYGFNFKFGGIVRPFEDNSFRIGVAIESPTWYKLKSRELMDICYYNEYWELIPHSPKVNRDNNSDIDYNLRTPWKFRASVGSTVGNRFAWDVDYEFANYSDMTQRYPKYNTFGGIEDVAMNEHMGLMLKGVHTIRAGIEIRPTSPLAFRLGYNFSSAAYENDATFDQYGLRNSPASDYFTRTSYMIAKPTHILGIGMGYKWKSFYIDLAYKIRHQKADFYSFDDSFAKPGETFAENNPDVIKYLDDPNKPLAPVPVDLTRHSISCTLGFKF